MEKTLADLKVGDEVLLVTNGRYGRQDTRLLRRIEGETATRWKVGDYQYDKQSGRRIGSDGSNLRPITDKQAAALRLEFEQKQLARLLCDFNYSALPLETLRAINALLPKENTHE